MVCDMSPAFLTAIGESSPSANVTMDWFHVVQLFTTAVDTVRKTEAKERTPPKATRWAVLKAADGGRLTEKQQQALTELKAGGFATATAWRLKEMLRWIRKITSVRAAQWRITHLTRHTLKCIALDTKTLAPVLKALMTIEEHAHLFLNRWISNHSNARLEGLNSVFQTTRARARDYRNVFTFMTMIYFMPRHWGNSSKSTINDEKPHFGAGGVQAHELGRHDDVGRTGDGQKFSGPLHHGQNQDLQDVHASTIG
ncbi:transposase [Desulfarculales bacterium]